MIYREGKGAGYLAEKRQHIVEFKVAFGLIERLLGVCVLGEELLQVH